MHSCFMFWIILSNMLPIINADCYLKTTSQIEQLNITRSQAKLVLCMMRVGVSTSYLY